MKTLAPLTMCCDICTLIDSHTPDYTRLTHRQPELAAQLTPTEFADLSARFQERVRKAVHRHIDARLERAALEDKAALTDEQVSIAEHDGVIPASSTTVQRGRRHSRM